MATGPVPEPPRQGEIWWSVAPPAETASHESGLQVIVGISDEQLQDWLSCTTGWKALELTWGALQSCEVRQPQLKPLLQAAMAEAARLGAPSLVVRQLDVDEVLGRCLALALSGFPNFTALKLRELNLYDEALGHLSGALHATEHLRSLVLDTVWASAGGWSALGAAIKVNTSLTSLRMRYCLRDAALAALCSALSDQHGCLETLRLSHNVLRDVGVEELCKALVKSFTQPTSRPSQVAHLDLSYNGASRQCVPGLTAMLRVVRTLRHLDLSYNDLGVEGVWELCSALSYAPHVTSLSLAATGAEDSSVEALTRGPLAPASALAVATSGLGGVVGVGSAALTTLCLAHNRISSRGAALLAAAVRRPGCPLVDVDLSGNALVGLEGAKSWAEVLSASSTSPGGASCRLRRLVLSGCEIPDAGAFALGAALKSNTSLEELGLAENHISMPGLALLAEVLKVNSTLKLLDVSFNMVGPRGMTPFTQMSHQRGHVALSKGYDHTGKGVRCCVVKAEVLREYRNVEDVKHSRKLWEEEERRYRQAAYVNPFLDPSFATAAAAAGFGAVTGRGGGGGDGCQMEHGGSYNPFLSPSASYINPFLDSSPATAAAQAAGGQDNPFRAPAGGRALNPFLAPTSMDAPANPFLSAPAAAAEAEADEGAITPSNTPGGIEGRELATRVLARLGSHGPALAANGGALGVEDGADGSDVGDGSGSATGIYVSSRSTADEADLVTDLDLRLVDFMLEHLRVGAADTSFAPQSSSHVGATFPRKKRSSFQDTDRHQASAFGGPQAERPLRDHPTGEGGARAGNVSAAGGEVEVEGSISTWEGRSVIGHVCWGESAAQGERLPGPASGQRQGIPCRWTHEHAHVAAFGGEGGEAMTGRGGKSGPFENVAEAHGVPGGRAAIGATTGHPPSDLVA